MGSSVGEGGRGWLTSDARAAVARRRRCLARADQLLALPDPADLPGAR